MRARGNSKLSVGVLVAAVQSSESEKWQVIAWMLYVDCCHI